MDELISECDQAYSRGDCGDKNEATFATIANTSAGHAKAGVAATTRAFTNAKSTTADRIADTRFTEIDPEWAYVYGFAVKKPHGCAWF